MSQTAPATIDEAVALIEAEAVIGDGDAPVEDVYCSDLLSDVLAHAAENCLWITVQNHRNIVAVAETRDVGAIVVAGGRPVLDETRRQAENLEVRVYRSPLTVYEIAGRLYTAGLGVQRTNGEKR